MVDRTQPRQSRRERIIRKLALLIVRGVFRRVDVVRVDASVSDRPRMSVSNHFGGFSDPLLLVYAMPRLPRIIARDVIWKFPPARWIMNWVGAIPVHKPEDRGPGSNDVMFASAYGALQEGSHLMIFPEGITRDEPSIAPIKTGAARIVLGARANGAEGIQITSAGITYENKASLRSAVSVQIGRPLDLDASIDEYVQPGDDQGPENRNAVRRLTDDIEIRLRRVAPDFQDWDEADALTAGADMLVRSLVDDPADEVPLAARDALAGYLGRRPGAAPLVTAVNAYQQELATVGLTDSGLLSGMTGRTFVRKFLGWLILSVVLLPFALVGAVINWIPYLLVKAVGLVRMAPAMAATVKPLAALVVFGITWALVIWAALRNNGVGGGALVMLLLPIYLGAVIVFFERAQLLWAAFRDWRGLRGAGDHRDSLLQQRRRLLDTLVEAL